MQVRALIAEIEALAPPHWAAAWDQSGVQAAVERQDVRRLGVGLDPTPEMIEQALAWGADFLLVHHPVAMKPELPARENGYAKVLGMVFRHNVWLYAAHTSLDVQPRGPVRWLARELGLENLGVLEETGRRAGRWFRILGHAGQLEELARNLAEYPGVEVYPCGARALEVVAAPGSDHQIFRAVSEGGGLLHVVSQELDMPVEPLGFGFVGDLGQPLPWNAFAANLERILGGPPRSLAGEAPVMVRRVACCPGSGASLLGRVGQTGAQVYVTGDVKYHDAQAAREQGILVVDVGHFALEERMMREFAETLRHILAPQGVDVAFFVGSDPLRRGYGNGHSGFGEKHPQ
ncbi:Nif3-like dinuclear metal center hexameric protein [Desulfonatronum thioautotrophicum]|uniref:Nif3-like dinuclear metal center hexameric protein n=1 Tax=Desulfonatronum thioautotrophicum TaxID=617001 RepID=UPI0005EB2BFA|nr:Nif3-like dinuclear metal center hexameric protein [Desulfonatronum thioautotrophicum]